MLNGNRKPRPPATRRRGVYRPSGEGLESRVVPVAIDLFNIAGNPNTTPPGGPPGPFGILMTGLATGGGAGFQVTEVGDVNGDQFDDFIVAAPTVIQASGGGVTDPPANRIVLGPGNNSQVFLVFGSRRVLPPLPPGAPPVSPNVDFLRSLAFQQRIGDLGALGNLNQTNPTIITPPLPPTPAGFDFNGLIFRASTSLTSQLGASIAALGDINNDGFADFMIGAPGGNDVNGQVAGVGRAFLVYGSPNLTRDPGQGPLAGMRTVDLEDPTPGANPDLRILTFVNTLPNTQTGFSVAAAGDVIADGIRDIAIGAPGASFNGLANNGAVFVVSGGVLQQARTATIRLDQVGQPGGPAGVIFAGARAGEQAGFTVATAGNFNNDATPAGVPSEDLLIGAPATTVGPGTVYLVYGADDLPGQALPSVGVPAPGLPLNISLTRIPGGDPPAPTGAPEIAGAAFVGDAQVAGDPITDQTGFAISTADDFNGDGVQDILIGSPGFNLSPTVLNSGRVSLIYGRAATPTPPGQIVGTFPLSNLPFPAVTFLGASAGDLAGYSVSATGLINTDELNEILIGAPGFNNGNGVVFLVPGNAGLLGNQSLDTALVQAAPVQALVITLSQAPPPPFFPNFLGSSVSGRPLFLIQPNKPRTIDTDTSADILIGAPGFSLLGFPQVAPRPLAGGGFVLEGAFIGPLLPVPPPPGTPPPGDGDITPSIFSIDGLAPPGPVPALTPPEMRIGIGSLPADITTGTPPFRPATEIDPTSIVVNGVPFPNATIMEVADQTADGLPDAIVTITPRTALNLTNQTTTLSVEGRTLPNAPNANQQFTASATIRVVGAGGGVGAPGLPPGLVDVSFLFPPNAAVPPFGERLIPQTQILGKLRWKPLPVRRAFRQFLPTDGFARRFNNFFHPQDGEELGSGSKGGNSQFRTSTLGRNVFTRGRFRPGQIHFPPIDHGQATIPPTRRR